MALSCCSDDIFLQANPEVGTAPGPLTISLWDLSVGFWIIAKNLCQTQVYDIYTSCSAK